MLSTRCLAVKTGYLFQQSWKQKKINLVSMFSLPNRWGQIEKRLIFHSAMSNILKHADIISLPIDVVGQLKLT